MSEDHQDAGEVIPVVTMVTDNGSPFRSFSVRDPLCPTGHLRARVAQRALRFADRGVSLGLFGVLNVQDTAIVVTFGGWLGTAAAFLGSVIIWIVGGP